MYSTAQAQADTLSELLGIKVVSLRRDPPAHERARVEVVGGRWVRRPAHEDVGLGRERVARQYWHLRLCGGDGRPLSLRLTSDQIREGRAFTDLLRRLGSKARLDNRTARTVLAVMHEVLEGAQR